MAGIRELSELHRLQGFSWLKAATSSNKKMKGTARLKPWEFVASEWNQEYLEKYATEKQKENFQRLKEAVDKNHDITWKELGTVLDADAFAVEEKP